jgi:hypothetical protein
MPTLSSILGSDIEVLDSQTFDTTGTWTKPAGSYAPTDMALIEMWGGGGPGHQVNSGIGIGGYAGGYFRFLVLLSSLGATEAVVVGAGGAAASNGGGDSSFDGITVKGGIRGNLGTAAAKQDRYDRNPIWVNAAGDGANSDGNTRQASVYGGSGGVAATAGTAPGGGGGGRVTPSGTNTAGAGATGRVKVRILRGASEFSIPQGSF